MPDIMMCEATGCHLSKQCRRHEGSGTIPDDRRQSYWMRDDESPVGDACGNYWERLPPPPSVRRR